MFDFFEWNDEKRQTNIAKHKVDFMRAVAIFDGPVVIKPDDRRDYGEDRYIAIGVVETDYYVVVYTQRDDVTRIISARIGGRRAKRDYHANEPRRNSGDEE